ncbi:MAG TPA: hypothetical protein VH986_12020 [Acidimicrobiia bacterium]
MKHEEDAPIGHAEPAPPPVTSGPGEPSRGIGFSNWFLHKATGFMEKHASRRGFLIGSALAGSAVAVTGLDFVTRPGTAYAQAVGCPPGALCGDGYTEFCCAINNGLNACPPGSFAGGWWRADHSSFCGGAARYYIDCMQNCCGQGIGGGFCAGCVACQCANGCDTRRVYCNYFRYGQCHQEIGVSGPIACRVVTCVPPYTVAEYACTTALAVDNSTAEHAGNCPPLPPPPPPVAAVLPSSGAAVALSAGLLSMCVRGADGAVWFMDFDGVAHPWNSLGGGLTSGLAIALVGNVTSALLRGNDNAVYEARRSGTGPWTSWASIGGLSRSDPAAVAHSSGLFAFVRGGDDGCYVNHASAPGAWSGWQPLGGSITSEPAAAVNQAGGIALVVRGSDNGVYLNRFVDGWTGFSSLGGATTADPVVAADANGFSVFVRGNDGAIYHCRVPNTGSPGGWVSLGGGATSDPAAAADANGMHVVVRGNDNAIWHRTPTTPWSSLGGGASADPVAVADANGGDTHVIIRGMDARMYHGTLATGGWLPLFGNTAPVRAGR